VTHDPAIAAQMDRTLTLTEGQLVGLEPAVV
jgi:predicted ABC-type transport system involved in lysophospholipase L1 biosynthesis ATPase subunit